MTILRGAAVALCLGLAIPASAAWELDNERSTLGFLSIKNASKGELHHFKSLSGSVSDAGKASVEVDLDSVGTAIPIRNQRMRELLFETVRFPQATLSASVPEELLALEEGDSASETVEVTVELHGASKSYSADMIVTRLADDSLQVTLREPLIVDAADFGLAGGVGTLKEVAGLASISTAVPVTATLVFTPE